MTHAVLLVALLVPQGYEQRARNAGRDVAEVAKIVKSLETGGEMAREAVAEVRGKYQKLKAKHDALIAEGRARDAAAREVEQIKKNIAQMEKDHERALKTYKDADARLKQKKKDLEARIADHKRRGRIHDSQDPEYMNNSQIRRYNRNARNLNEEGREIKSDINHHNNVLVKEVDRLREKANSVLKGLRSERTRRDNKSYQHSDAVTAFVNRLNSLMPKARALLVTLKGEAGRKIAPTAFATFNTDTDATVGPFAKAYGSKVAVPEAGVFVLRPGQRNSMEERMRLGRWVPRLERYAAHEPEGVAPADVADPVKVGTPFKSFDWHVIDVATEALKFRGPSGIRGS